MSWRRKNELDDLEARLRAAARTSEELVQSCPARFAACGGADGRPARLRLCADPRPRRHARSAGGLSHTATAASGVVTFVQTGSFSPSRPRTGRHRVAVFRDTESDTASDDQYEEDVTICHRTRANQTGNTLTVSPSGATNHLANHQYDYAALPVVRRTGKTHHGNG